MSPALARIEDSSESLERAGSNYEVSTRISLCLVRTSVSEAGAP